MKKVIGQTVRDLKREVNKKVLKVPGIEQKVLDATSNEPWGPHGSLLADIAQATRNYHEYQMIMVVLWKRLNDTGKNWRHVYKALTVLEYLVANGSERVIDEIKEHAYQLSALSNFQYIDSGGRDQGNNVRRKSQSLVALVNDKEKIIEVRQKAAANRDKFRSVSSGGMYRPGSYPGGGGYGDRYDDDRYNSRYGSRDEERYGREREWGDEKYGRSGDSYGRDGEDRYGRDGYRDDDYRGRPRSVDDYQYGSRSRSSDRDRSYDDDGQYSSRGSGARAEDSSLDGGRIERKFSEQNLDGKFSEQNHGAPPSYEEVVGESRSPVHSERDGDTSNASVHRSPSPVNNNTAQDTSTTVGQNTEAPDEFDPRGPVAASPAAATDAAPSATYQGTASASSEFDLLGSLSDSFSPSATVVVPPTSANSEANTFAAQTMPDFGNQTFEDPFGDNPFKAIPSNEIVTPEANVSASASPFQPIPYQNAEPLHAGSSQMGATSNVDSGDSFLALTYPASSAAPSSVDSKLPVQEFSTLDNSTDILAGILPPSGASAGESQDTFPAPAVDITFPGANTFGSVQPHLGQSAPAASNMVPQTQLGLNQQASNGAFPSQGGSVAPVGQMNVQYPMGTVSQFNGSFLNQPSATAPTMVASPFPQPPAGPDAPFNGGNFLSQMSSAAAAPFTSQMAPHQPGGQHAQYQNASLLSQQVSASPAPVPSQVAPHPSFGAAAQNTGNFLPQQFSQIPSQTLTGQGPQQVSSAPAPNLQMASHPSLSNAGSFLPQQSLPTPVSQMSSQIQTGQGPRSSNDALGNLLGQSGLSTTMSSQPNPSFSVGAPSATQPSKEKFETKSAIWTDTLSRGLVNLNISGPKINPLADIGIDFDALNRKEKRMEKPATTTVTSTVTMGKAMGSGSGMGRAGASALRAPPNPMMNPGMGMAGGQGGGMGMGMGGGPGVGMGMGGGYGGMNQPMGMNMGMGMGMNMGVGQGPQMQRPTAMPPGPGPNMSGGYNPMMGGGGYSQNPYGGYR